MNLVSFISFKGGAGKTTALMAIASTLVEMGHKVLILEADENKPLQLWRDAAQERGTWSDLVRISPADSLDAIQAAFEKAETDGFEFCFADTAGGGSDLNTMLIINSDLVIVPSTLSLLDIDGALSTMEFVVGEVSRSVGRKIPTRLLLGNFLFRSLKSGEQESLAMISQVPQFKSRLTQRAAFADLRRAGLLGEYYKVLLANPAKKLLAGHLVVAVNEARDVTTEMLDMLIGAPR